MANDTINTSASSANPEYIKGTLDGLYDSMDSYFSGTTVNIANVVTILSYTSTYTGKHYVAASAQDGVSTGYYAGQAPNNSVAGYSPDINHTSSTIDFSLWKNTFTQDYLL